MLVDTLTKECILEWLAAEIQFSPFREKRRDDRLIGLVVRLHSTHNALAHNVIIVPLCYANVMFVCGNKITCNANF